MGKLSIAVVVVLVLALIGATIVLLRRPLPEPPAFIEATLDEGLDRLVKAVQEPAFGTVLNAPSGAGSTVIDLVGSIIIDTGEEGAGRYKIVTGQFRPEDDALRFDPVDEPLFEGKVSNKITSTAALQPLAVTLKAEEAAEVLIRNQWIIRWKERKAIPWPKLAQAPLEKNKRYFFIESILMTTVTSRTFKKVESAAEIGGTAFKADGSLYSSSGGFLVKNLMVARMVDLHYLQAANVLGAMKGFLGAEEPTEHGSMKLMSLLEPASSKRARETLFGVSPESWEVLTAERLPDDVKPNRIELDPTGG